ncbi:unnamed protein product [Lactuca saligna]|uniref:Aminotransferase class I/classII large domain-containing protein n=1 Tax=Lactuca saligna TaxID=75948 RepID=A0AA35ZYS5_LACSI|nr:unnamed protein product [Lactuca saligna]
MTTLPSLQSAERSNAINLAEGFPDFPAPPHIKAAAVSPITSDFNKYRLIANKERAYLDPRYWRLNEVKLVDGFTTKTKALVLNRPHNPTGKVFNMEALQIIAEYCITKDCIAVFFRKKSMNI